MKTILILNDLIQSKTKAMLAKFDTILLKLGVVVPWYHHAMLV